MRRERPLILAVDDEPANLALLNKPIRKAPLLDLLAEHGAAPVVQP